MFPYCYLPNIPNFDAFPIDLHIIENLFILLKVNSKRPLALCDLASIMIHPFHSQSHFGLISYKLYLSIIDELLLKFVVFLLAGEFLCLPSIHCSGHVTIRI
jgi:hypothetical protein